MEIYDYNTASNLEICICSLANNIDIEKLKEKIFKIIILIDEEYVHVILEFTGYGCSL